MVTIVKPRLVMPRSVINGLSQKYAGRITGVHIIELARAGNGNELHYVIGHRDYQELLWERDNQKNNTSNEDKFFIGRSAAERIS